LGASTRRAAVVGGHDRWRRRIDGLANELRRKLAEIGGKDETQAAALARTLDDLAAFAAYALPLIDELDSLPAEACWGEWLDRLGTIATRTLKQPDRVLAILSELAPMAPVGPVELNEVLIVLRSLLLETAVPPPVQRYGRVFVGPIDAAAISTHSRPSPGAENTSISLSASASAGFSCSLKR
jgi:hypothetical protein